MEDTKIILITYINHTKPLQGNDKRSDTDNGTNINQLKYKAMGKQTYIIHTSGGGETNFYRVSCKKVETCLKYLKGWRDQANEKGWNYLYKDLLSDDSTYKIISTPDGYHEKDLVASGLISEL